GAVGTEETERLSPPHVDVDAVDRGEAVEPLGEAASVHQAVGGGLGHGFDATEPVGQFRLSFAAGGAGWDTGSPPQLRLRRRSAGWSAQRLGKNRASSRLADSGESEPCTMFFCTSMARGPSTTAATSGPEVMKSTSGPKNGFSRCSA